MTNQFYKDKKVFVDGIKFDSGQEAMFYEELKERKAKGLIKSFECHPKFILQPAFKKNGVSHRAITYSADFEIVHNDGKIETIDVKGFETAMFKLKMKLFEYTHPDRQLVLLKYSKLDGGFVLPEVYKAGVAQRKIERARKKAEKERLKQEKLKNKGLKNKQNG